jgi:KDO2-lipid IV(A) lauroyltransferase
MYYLVFGILYLFSLLPFRILYWFSDFCCFMVYHVIGYRKKVVMDNLRNAFPQKSEDEIKKICRDFYRNFCDNWLEMLKILSVSKKNLSKRITYDFSLLEELYMTGKTIQIYAGHFMNWEYTTLSMPGNQPFPMLAIYMPVGNDIFDRLIRHLRTRFGTILLRAGNVKRDMVPWEKQQHMMGFIADQSPHNSMQAYWMYFMNQPTGFLRKPWVLVRRQQQPAVYLKVKRIKRGHYFFEVVAITLDPAHSNDKDLALKYRDLLEEDINNYPDNYLCTHRRWKRKWQEEYRELWIDRQPAPEPGKVMVNSC